MRPVTDRGVPVVSYVGGTVAGRVKSTSLCGWCIGGDRPSGDGQLHWWDRPCYVWKGLLSASGPRL